MTLTRRKAQSALEKHLHPPADTSTQNPCPLCGNRCAEESRRADSVFSLDPFPCVHIRACVEERHQQALSIVATQLWKSISEILADSEDAALALDWLSRLTAESPSEVCFDSNSHHVLRLGVLFRSLGLLSRLCRRTWPRRRNPH